MKQTNDFTELNSIHVANVIAEKIYTEKNMALTLTQKKMVLYLASLIEETDTELQEIILPISEYYRLMHLKQSGGYKAELEKSLVSFCSKCFLLPLKNGQYKIVCRWLDKAMIDYDKNELHLKLDDTLKPYFLDLSKKARTIFQLGYVLKFKYKYSPDIYMFASRCKNLNAPYLVPIEEAYKRFGEGRYTKYYDLKRKVLDKAINEINTLTDLNITVKKIEKNRKITHIAFMVFKKTGDALKAVDDWKVEIKKTKSIHDKIREAFEDDLIQEAVNRNFIDADEPDDFDDFDYDEYMERFKSHYTKPKEIELNDDDFDDDEDEFEEFELDGVHYIKRK